MWLDEGRWERAAEVSKVTRDRVMAGLPEHRKGCSVIQNPLEDFKSRTDEAGALRQSVGDKCGSRCQRVCVCACLVPRLRPRTLCVLCSALPWHSYIPSLAGHLSQ